MAESEEELKSLLMKVKEETEKVGIREFKQGVCINLDGWDGEGDGNPLQCSCLENPRDGGAW